MWIVAWGEGVCRHGDDADSSQRSTDGWRWLWDSGSGAASSKDIEKNVDNDDNEDVGELSMTCG